MSSYQHHPIIPSLCPQKVCKFLLFLFILFTQSTHTHIHSIKKTCTSNFTTRLLLMGGFDELHGWLKEARSQINKPLMLELLQLFKQLPVSTKLLRTNSCAKDIKQLIKNNDESTLPTPLLLPPLILPHSSLIRFVQINYSFFL